MTSLSSPLRQHRSAQLHVLPEALGHVGDRRLPAASGSSLSLRGFYSTFKNWGQKWVYTLNDGDIPAASIDWRRPDSVGNLVAAAVTHSGRTG